MKHAELTDVIISSFYKVYNSLGYGFLEKVYENALFYELSKRNLSCMKQQKIIVRYDSLEVGEYYADICVEIR